MNAPPPNWATWPGKRMKFPRPTALPATARIMPIREPQESRPFAAMGRMVASLPAAAK